MRLKEITSAEDFMVNGLTFGQWMGQVKSIIMKGSTGLDVLYSNWREHWEMGMTPEDAADSMLKFNKDTRNGRGLGEGKTTARWAEPESHGNLKWDDWVIAVKQETEYILPELMHTSEGQNAFYQYPYWDKMFGRYEKAHGTSYTPRQAAAVWADEAQGIELAEMSPPPIDLREPGEKKKKGQAVLKKARNGHKNRDFSYHSWLREVNAELISKHGLTLKKVAASTNTEAWDLAGMYARKESPEDAAMAGIGAQGKQSLAHMPRRGDY